MATTDEELAFFWDHSVNKQIGIGITDASDIFLGVGEKLAPKQKSIIKGLWDRFSKAVKPLDTLLMNVGMNTLKSFGVDAAAAQRIMSTLIRTIPDVPMFRQTAVFAAYLFFSMQILIKGFGSAGDQLDKVMRKQIQPGVGSYTDWLTAAWRGMETAELAGYNDETGMPPEWRKIITRASEWWVDVPILQELRRRGAIDDIEFRDHLFSAGVRDEKWHKLLPELTWNVLPINTVLEYYRRSNLDAEKVEGLLKAAGFGGENVDALLSTAYRMLEEPTLFELRRRELISDRDYNRYLESYGYDKTDQKRVSALYQRLPDQFQLRQMHFRGIIRKPEYLDWLAKLGFNEKDADRIEQTDWFLPGPADLMRFGVREVFTPAIARRFGQYEQYPQGITEWAKKIGITEEIAEMYWAAHWNLPAVGQMFDMFHRGIITRADLRMGVRAQDVMPFWQPKVIELSYRLIPRRTLPRLSRQGLITFTGLVGRFKKLGYKPADSTIMARSAELAAVEEEKALTRTDIVNAIRYGWYTVEKARGALEALQYTTNAIDFYIADGLRRKALQDARGAAEGITEITSEAVDLTASEIIRGFAGGMIDRSRAESLLGELGLADSAIEFKLTLAELRRIRQNKEHAAKQYKKLFEKHLLTPVDLQNRLMTAGYTAAEVSMLVDEWTLERTVEDQLDGVRDRLPTVTDIEKWLKLGIMTVEEWVDYMQQQGYADDIISMNLEEIILTQGTT